MNNSVRVFAPATIANVACAFDVLGFAIDQPGDVVIATLSSKPGAHITKISGDENRLPIDVTKNTAGVSVAAFLKHIQSKNGIEIELQKGLNIGSGLGSSSASTVAAVVAANELMGKPLSRRELLPFAMEGEKVACGTAHADNVAPCLLGGFVLIRSYAPLDVIELGAPENLYCAVVSPNVEVRTEDARKILRKQISLKDAVVQWGNVAGLVTGLLKSDHSLIHRSLNDVIIEPERAVLIPGFAEVKQAALDCGVLGCSISGSGPSIFALTSDAEIAQKSATSMQQAFKSCGIQSLAFSSRINPVGTRVMESK